MESKGNTLVSPFMKEEITTDGFFNGSALFEDMPAALYTCDAEGKITFFNQAATDLWGRTPEIGKDSWCGSWKIFDASGFPINHDQCSMATTLKERRKIENQEMLIERPDGKRIYVLPHAKPIFDANGNMTGAINMLVDITYTKTKETTPEKEAPKNLAFMDSEERYHKMIDEVQDYAILLLDKDGSILNWNKGAQNIKGYTEAEILGKNFRVFYLPEDQENKLPEKLMQEAIEKGKAMNEGWRLRKDGTRFWGYVVITALHDSENNIIGFSKVTRDLTERKKTEDQLRYYAKSTESQNKQLEQYAYIASHDLQEPLRKIRFFAGLLEDNIENPDIVKTNIGKINIAATRMSALITDILKYSQLAQLDKLFKPTDLNEVLESVKQDFDLIMEEKSVVIESTKLPVLDGIPMQLHQLFANLISNAIKFSREKPVINISYRKISNEKVAECPELPFENTYHQISFTDNGIGFEQQYADQAFKLFHRLHEKTSGTGIGLALCKKIIENHKGYICVHSEPGQGATFTVFFPV